MIAPVGQRTLQDFFSQSTQLLLSTISKKRPVILIES